mgnify:CR=1 FL=1
MNQDLKIIKKKYGEKMMHLCRTLFPTILEEEGLLPKLLESKFYPSRYLYYDIVGRNFVLEFQDFIYGLMKKEKIKENDIKQTPYELLDKAGYILYECKTEKDIQSFKKYYKKDEQLCTFRGGRLNSCYVFFAVKKDVENIKREDFENPKRQDLYGTSVISIQVGRVNSYLSIKNRYNHRVINPDATFNNNLDNIIPGLTKSFNDNYNFNISKERKDDFELPRYVKANDGKYYKYNYEINNIYYCPDNIIIENFEVNRTYQDKSRYIIFDYFILDMKEKTINLYDNSISESFHCYNKGIEQIEVKKENNKKYIILKKLDHKIVIVLDNENKMISYHNDLITKIGSYFLEYNKYLEKIYLNNVKKIQDRFLGHNNKLDCLQIPLLETCGNNFLMCNEDLREIRLPNLKYVGYNFIWRNANIEKIYLPNLKEVGNHFLSSNKYLDYLELPNLIKVGDDFVRANEMIAFLYAPSLIEVGSEFMSLNDSLTSLELPNLKTFGYFFLENNTKLKELRLPKLEEIGVHYLKYNTKIKILEIPEVISNRFIYNAPFKENFRHKQKQLVLV